MPPLTPPTRRTYIHIGVPKSGTSFIQATLRENSQNLLESGFLYPSRHKDDMFHAALDVNGNHARWGVAPERAAGTWAAMCARARDFDGTTVISSEFFCGARPKQIREALAELDGTEVHVIVTARDMARQIPAEWQEGIKHGRSLTFKQFQSRILDPDRRHQHARRFWHYQDLPEVLGRWAEAVTEERVHLITCPPPGADPQLLWDRFCSVVGIDPAGTTLPQASVNSSLGITEIEVLRHINRAVRHHEDPHAYGRLVKQLVVRSSLRKHSSPRAQTPAHLLPALDDLAKQWRSTIEAHRYDIVGDLDELDPVAPAATGNDPDRVPPRKALVVATASIGDLLVEVARLREQNRELRQELRSRRGLLRRVASRVRNLLRR